MRRRHQALPIKCVRQKFKLELFLNGEPLKQKHSEVLAQEPQHILLLILNDVLRVSDAPEKQNFERV